MSIFFFFFFFFSSRRRHTRFSRDWSSDVCSSDLGGHVADVPHEGRRRGRAPRGPGREEPREPRDARVDRRARGLRRQAERGPPVAAKDTQLALVVGNVTERLQYASDRALSLYEAHQ